MVLLAVKRDLWHFLQTGEFVDANTWFTARLKIRGRDKVAQSRKKWLIVRLLSALLRLSSTTKKKLVESCLRLKMPPMNPNRINERETRGFSFSPNCCEFIDFIPEKVDCRCELNPWRAWENNISIARHWPSWAPQVNRSLVRRGTTKCRIWQQRWHCGCCCCLVGVRWLKRDHTRRSGTPKKTSPTYYNRTHIYYPIRAQEQ